MKKLKRIWLVATPMLAVLAVVMLVAALFRGFSIKSEEGGQGDAYIPAGTLTRYIWLEISQLFKFSRY